MRVLTCNVWGRFGPWEDRDPAISATVGSVRPDLLALQESWSCGNLVQAQSLGSLARAGRSTDSVRVEGADLAGLPGSGQTVPSDHYAVVADLNGRRACPTPR